jgi:REP element-mobilizing transposase RayT
MWSSLPAFAFRNRFRYNTLRYAGRDYSLPGKYFVTICTAGTKEWFGKVIFGKMYLSEIGHIASRMWYEIPVHFPFIDLDAFAVMPNHIHWIIAINRFIGTPIVGALHATPLPLNDATHLSNETMSFISPKSGSLSVVVRSYKSAVTKHVHRLDSHFSWQHGFYDTIIYTTGQLSRIRKYISENTQYYSGKV